MQQNIISDVFSSGLLHNFVKIQRLLFFVNLSIRAWNCMLLWYSKLAIVRLEGTLTLHWCASQAIVYRYGEGLCGRPSCCAWQNLYPWDRAWSAASMDTGVGGYGQMTSPGDVRWDGRWSRRSMWRAICCVLAVVPVWRVLFAVHHCH